MEVVSICTNYCDNCAYKKMMSSNYKYCDYFLMTNERRPCPAGDGCTVKVSRKVYRRKRIPKDVLIAHNEKEKERNRRKSRAYYEKHKDEINARAKAKRQAKLAECGG